MIALLIDTENQKETVVEIDDNEPLREYYRLLKCKLVDITYRRIGGKYYDIVVDKEGLFKPEPKVSALDSNGQPALVGNLLIYNYDEDDTCSSLTGYDIAHIREFITYIYEVDEDTDDTKALLVVTNVDP